MNRGLTLHRLVVSLIASHTQPPLRKGHIDSATSDVASSCGRIYGRQHDQDLVKVLITGVTGQVGSYLADAMRDSADVFAPTRAELDLQSEASIRSMVRQVQPDWILHPAAYTAVDRAESERELCIAVNAAATRTFAEESLRLGAGLVTFSTDYVFDGSADRAYREGDPTNPINTYGESKLLAEQALQEVGGLYFNFRTSWVYSARGNNFVKTMLRLASTRPELKVVADQQGCPSSASEIAASVARLVRMPKGTLEGKGGNYHLAGEGETTWFDFAREVIAEARKLKPEIQWTEPQPVPSSVYVTAARRPANSRLCCDRVRESLGLSMPNWKQSTAEVVRELLLQQ